MTADEAGQAPPSHSQAPPARATTDGLELFHPLVARWFRERLGSPTDVQQKSWPLIAAGEHLLITAPTGSGKTLTAFLWALDRLVRGEWDAGATRVLYVSPLKALNNDIRRNLLRPLRELRETFAAAAAPFPEIRVQTRSGDTPQPERRAMLRRPPEILITTPESLNLLLSSRGGIGLLGNVATVILDEVHSVVGNKRGVHAITAVERLVPLCGEFQRIALSATVKPLQTVAEFVGGLRPEGEEGEQRLRPRPVRIVQSADAKQYDIRVRFPATAADEQGADRESVWPPLVEEFSRIIAGNQSTLLFANNRRLCEKLTLLINDGGGHPLAYAHHGSLSREIRETVEGKLKDGELRAIVATASLELGIDIGALDEVVLVQSPHSIASGIQRIGRAGHDVGEVSRGTLYPTYSSDFIESAVMAAGVLNQDIEEVRPVDAPLDVLAQVVVSMAALEPRDLDEVYRVVRSSYPYRDLGRRQFDLVVDMLAGRYAHTRIRELQPKLSVDRLDNTIAARRGAVQDLYFSGGTIPDRGYFHLRVEASNARIGELDEEFVWECSEGQTFTMGSQSWTIRRITHNDVFVTPSPPKAGDLPFWKADGGGRDFHFSERIGQFLEIADSSLDDPGFRQRLQRDHAMDETAAGQLLELLRRQKKETGCPLPHRRHVVVEYAGSAPLGHEGNQVVLHTFWGERVNRPFALALDAAWEERFGQRLEIYPANDCIAMVLPHEIEAEELLSLVPPVRLDDHLRQRLESSGYFGARFRECCGRALLLGRKRMNQRLPLWMTRLRSQKLLDSVRRFDDFPILIEAWRSCLQDEFDMPALQQLLTELESGGISWSAAHTEQPSSFARVISWRQVDSYMYRGDEPAAAEPSRLRGDLMREVVFSADLRPAVPAVVVRSFVEKRQRLAPGYSPRSARELVDWAVERLLIPMGEWEELIAAIDRDKGIDLDAGEGAADLVAAAGDRLVRVVAEGTVLIAAREQLPWLGKAWSRLPGSGSRVEVLADGSAAVVPQEAGGAEGEGDAEEDGGLTGLIGRWLQFYGPLSHAEIEGVLGIEPALLRQALDDLVDSEAAVRGQLIAGTGTGTWCDAENLEILLRLACADAVPAFRPLPLSRLPLFLGAWQGLTDTEADAEALPRRLEQLLCYEAAAAAWEGEFLPARLPGYSTSWMDACMQESSLRWVGRGSERVALGFDADLDLLPAPAGPDAGEEDKPAEAEGGRGSRAVSRSGRPLRLRHPATADRDGRVRPGAAALVGGLGGAGHQRQLQRPAQGDRDALRGPGGRGRGRAPPRDRRARGLLPLEGIAAVRRQLAPAAGSGAGRGPPGGRGALQGARASAARSLRPAVPRAAAAGIRPVPLVPPVPLPAPDGAVGGDPFRLLLREHPGSAVHLAAGLPQAAAGPARKGGLLDQRHRSGLPLRPAAGGGKGLPPEAGRRHPPRLPWPRSRRRLGAPGPGVDLPGGCGQPRPAALFRFSPSSPDGAVPLFATRGDRNHRWKSGVRQSLPRRPAHLLRGSARLQRGRDHERQVAKMAAPGERLPQEICRAARTELSGWTGKAGKVGYGPTEQRGFRAFSKGSAMTDQVTAEDILAAKGGDLLSIPEDATIGEALEVMVEGKVGSILVREGSRIVGIYTERDLMRNAIGAGFDPGKARIGDHMTRGLKFASHTDTAYELMDKFLGLRIRHLLIDKHDKFIGLLSVGDVIKAALQARTDELEELEAIAKWEYYEEWKPRR